MFFKYWIITFGVCVCALNFVMARQSVKKHNDDFQYIQTLLLYAIVSELFGISLIILGNGV